MTTAATWKLADRVVVWSEEPERRNIQTIGKVVSAGPSLERMAWQYSLPITVPSAASMHRSPKCSLGYSETKFYVFVTVKVDTDSGRWEMHGHINYLKTARKNFWRFAGSNLGYCQSVSISF